jgi:alpha-glucosidase
MKRSFSTIAALLVVPLAGSLTLAPSAQAASAPQTQETPAVGPIDAAQPGPARAGIGSVPEKSWTVDAPSGRVTATLVRDPADGRLSLTVLRGGRTAVTSPLGIETDSADLSKGLTLTGLRRSQVTEDYSTVVGKRHQHHDVGNQLTAHFRTAQGEELGVQVRAFDDGVGYRYLLPGTGQITVTGERSGFRLPPASEAVLMEHRSNYENQYQRLQVDQVKQVPYAFPALFHLPGGGWTLVTEADVDGRYAASHLAPTGQPGAFRVTLPETSVTSSGPLATPWRVAVVGELSSVVESDLVTDLAGDSRVAETDWVRPGTVAWSWWSDGGSPRSFERQKDYVHHAAEEGWEYVLVDEGWSPEWMPELVSYARDKGVEVLIWARWNDLETQQQRDTLLPRWKSWGIAGVKLDFMNSDSQARMKWYDDVLRDTAKERLMVNLHGSTAPRGIERTWPHVLTTEGVRGGEDHHFGWVTPQHNVNLALTRNVVGSMDYTPLTFSAERRETSAGHELALSVVFESGWLHPADSVEEYDSRGVVEAVLRQMPTTWDQTELLSATPDSEATFARRSGERWFVGSAHAGPGTPTAVPLDFLDEGREYVAEVVRDRGHDDLVVDRRTVTSGDTLTVDSATNGGFVVLLSPTGAGPALDDSLLTRVTLDAERRWPEAGTTDPMTVRVQNKGSEPLRDVEAELSLPDGWTAAPVGSTTAEAVQPGEAATFTWMVKVRDDAAAGSRHNVAADVTYNSGPQPVERTAVRQLVIAPSKAPSGSPYLSDLPMYDSFNWVGPLERDQSNGGAASGDGSPITIEGRTFEKGLGGYAHSEQVLYLGEACDRLTGYVGVDDAVGDKGSVSFQVWGDDRLLYDSGPMTGADAARRMDVPVSSSEGLRLVLVDGGDFVADDQGDWADARLTC